MRSGFMYLALTAPLILGAMLAESGEVGPAGQYVILRNGHVLHGLVTPVGERYTVAVSADATRQVVVPASDVEFVCASLDEAYSRKLSTLSARDIAGRLSLAEWCLRHGLLARAADQLLAVRNLDPRHSRLAPLERRLEQASRPAPVPREPSKAVAPVARASADVGGSETLRPDPRTERFTSTVQPFLLQRCAGNSCHSATGTSSLRLIRPRHGDALASRFSRKNAASAMAYLDLDHPENSRLLTIPAGPHGSLGVPLLSPGDGHYERILAWIRGVAEYQTELSSETGAPDGDVESIPLTALGTPSSEPSRTTAVAGVVGPTITRLPATDSLPQAAVSAREPPAPRDPFDPEVFNRELPDGP